MYPVDESFGLVDTFAAAMLGYMNYYVKAVNKAIDLGYSWPVVSRMLRDKMDESKFINLEGIIEAINENLRT